MSLFVLVTMVDITVHLTETYEVFTSEKSHSLVMTQGSYPFFPKRIRHNVTQLNLDFDWVNAGLKVSERTYKGR